MLRVGKSLPTPLPDFLRFRLDKLIPELRVIHDLVLQPVVMIRIIPAPLKSDDTEDSFSIIAEVQGVRAVSGSILVPILDITLPHMVLREMPAIALIVNPPLPVVIPRLSHSEPAFKLLLK